MIKPIDVSPGKLVQYFDKTALVVRPACLNDLVATYGFSGSSFRPGYWIILMEERMYIVNQDVLGKIK